MLHDCGFSTFISSGSKLELEGGRIYMCYPYTFDSVVWRRFCFLNTVVKHGIYSQRVLCSYRNACNPATEHFCVRVSSKCYEIPSISPRYSDFFVVYTRFLRSLERMQTARDYWANILKKKKMDEELFPPKGMVAFCVHGRGAVTIWRKNSAIWWSLGKGFPPLKLHNPTGLY